MSEGFALLNSVNAAGIGGNVNRGRESKASFGDTTRKKLADITNMPQQDRSLTQNDKSQVVPIAAKEYIEQLQKENLALKNVLADRNKLIELTGVELQKLRLNLQKMQQQNLQLAQSNSQILQELNSGKDRLKLLQHELGCKNGMLKAKDLEMKEHLKEKKCEELGNEVKHTHCKATKVSSKVGTNDDRIEPNKRTRKSKSFNSNGEVQLSNEIENKRPCARRQSRSFNDQDLNPAEDQLEMAAPETSQCQPNDNDRLPGIHSTSASLSVQNADNTGIDAPKQALGNKRPVVRRQSARFKSQEPNPSEDFVDIKGGKVSAPACLSLSSRDEGAEVDLDCAFPVEESRRSSISRPSRQAAKKVQTYKEVPLNVKMRRPV